MTPEEITQLNAERQRLGMEWAGPSLIKAELDKPGQVEIWVVSDEKCLVPRPELEAMLSDASIGNLLTALETSPVLAYRWQSLDNPDMAHPVMRGQVEGLATAGVITADEATNLLRLGERLQTRSEELFGRNLTVAEITEAFDAV